MRCPQCEAAGLRSRVYEGSSSVTCMGVSHYWDEDGVEVWDDPNISTTTYSCSEGHHWTVRMQRRRVLDD